MAYRIDYGPLKYHSKKKKSIHWVLYASAVMVLLLIGMNLFGARNAIAKNLLPGDPAVTAMALDNMVHNLREGETFGQVFTCFCQEILNGANLS